jgi:lactoylglutathione lyase
MYDPTATDFETTRLIWGTDVAKPRLLHLALRVADIDAATRFYVEGLEMRVLDRIYITPAKMTAVFVGYGDYASGGLIELCRYWEDELPYTHGTGFGHISIGVADVTASVARLEALGAQVTVPPKDYAGGGPRIAYVKDLDGYVVELIQTVA